MMSLMENQLVMVSIDAQDNVIFICYPDDIEFDLIPELQVLRDEPEFSALGSMENIIRKVREDMSGVDSATLVISGQRMSITTLVRSGEDDIARFETKNMVETLIQHVLCCAQVTMAT